MRRPSLPTVISSAALFIALGGTSYAVIRLPANSVGNRQLKADSVSGSKIRNHSVGVKDLAASARGRRGPRGLKGSPGTSGSGASTVEPWHPLAFSAGWTNYGGGWLEAAYRKDPLGKVHLRGLVKKDGVPASLEVIGTLPPGYRPPAKALFAVAAGAATDIYGRVDVYPNGDIVFVAGSTVDADFTGLDTISFWTD
jgi:hypothetical protein